MDAVQHAIDPSNTVMVWNVVISDSGKPFIIPVLGLLVGGFMMTIDATKTVGKLVLYFGAQSFMNIYMAWVMRTSVTLPAGTFVVATNSTLTNDLTGCPVGFALTAMQQVVSFVVFVIFFSLAYNTPCRYMPKQLNGPFEVFCVIVFGCVFALNIALNNFSLGYISIAVNLIIRSCLPLTTYLSQQGLAMVGLYPFKSCRPLEITLMVIGVVCAGIFTVARIMGDKGSPADCHNMLLGVCICVASLFCGSLNLALAGVLGETHLNVYDTVAYMAIPATIFLLPLALFVQKPVPVEWGNVFEVDYMSDWEILQGVWSINKKTVAWLALSGVFSFMYNVVQFSVVHTLSPSATAFGGNFNKAALIFLTLLLPFLRVHDLPGSPYIQVIWVAVIVNIAAFSLYGHLQIQAKVGVAPVEDVHSRGESDDSEYLSSNSEDGSTVGMLSCCTSNWRTKQEKRNLTPASP